MLLNETPTTICNRALRLIGEKPVNSIDDNSTESARVCKQFYVYSLRSVLEEGEWPFATIETPVTRITAPDYMKEQKYMYEIPSNCALIVGLSKRYNRKSMQKGIDWDIRFIPSLSKAVIVCNLESTTSDEITDTTEQDEQILIEYIADTQLTSSYTAAFLRCLVAQLAADICMPITHDTQKWSAMMQYASAEKSKALQQALNQDGQDKMAWIDPLTASREGCIK